MDDRNLRDAIEDFKVNRKVKEAGMTEDGGILRYTLLALDHGLQLALQTLGKESAQEFSQRYYTGAVQYLADLPAYTGSLKEKLGGETYPLL